jgi:predicted Zn-dependent protease
MTVSPWKGPRFMERNAFIKSLVTAVGVTQLTHVTAAFAALDEAQIGREVFAQLRESGDLLFDSSYYEHLNEVGSVIADAVKSRYEYPIRYYIVRGDSANAFSVPGGNIYVNEPLLKLAKNKDELAGVLAHETGHMVLHHVAKRMANADKVGAVRTVGGILAQVLMGPLGGMAADSAMGVGQAKQDANLSMHIEAQADEEGARIVAATNTYNPYGMVWFFQTMTATYGAGQASYLRDHPLDAARIDDLMKMITTNPQIFGKFKDTQQRDVAYW